MNKANIIGWCLTLALSICGAYAAMNARIYEVEAKIKLLELQQSTNDFRLKKAEDNYEKIEQSLFRIENQLIQKADKKYIP